MALVENAEAKYDEREINFRETVQPGQGVTVTRSFSLLGAKEGRITKVMFSFPPGTLCLTDVRLEKDMKAFYPLQGYIALDNATPVYHTSVDYNAHEPLTLTIMNRDERWEHTITCTVVIRFKRSGWW